MGLGLQVSEPPESQTPDIDSGFTYTLNPKP